MRSKEKRDRKTEREIEKKSMRETDKETKGQKDKKTKRKQGPAANDASSCIFGHILL